MVRFTEGPDGDTDDLTAKEEVFEARTVLRPDPITRSGAPGGRGARVTREGLMDQIDDPVYAEAIGSLLDAADANALTIWWGTKGLSIRLPSPVGGPAASVAWVNPPGDGGWLGLTDLVLGYDPNSPAYEPLKEILVAYIDQVRALGGDPLTNGGLVAQHLSPEVTTGRIGEIIGMLDARRDQALFVALDQAL